MSWFVYKKSESITSDFIKLLFIKLLCVFLEQSMGLFILFVIYSINSDKEINPV